MAYTVKITNVLSLTHNVKQIKTEKPKDYKFTPGQATEVAINKKGWTEEKRPFTFTSLPEDNHLEFVIKTYHDHEGVTHEIDSLVEGDELIIDDAWGAIEYKGTGTFIAGGAGVTPFIAIFRNLEKKNEVGENKLIFSNKRGDDVILESYFNDILGDNFISTLTHQNIEGHENEMVDMEFLNKHLEDFTQHFYVCGPDAMVKDVSKQLEMLGASPKGITFEK
ncbi:FAD-binding oxidoreductase [Marivirga salinae]|uniref:FAD-binding oxidoreductase n=1 Tax=Marivirga salinarum TaxID=3059078 RepID=A0AA51RF23_9BACT|nr:FAD-binding oxidoreductase [Marivirga sp. BDSF4-3]WMN12570.1 FAD-binding oxidoreductase [Marivirga sp. BDSF4-3]